MKNKVLYVSSANPFSYGRGSQANRAYLDATMDYYGRENVILMVSEDIDIPDSYSDLTCVKVKERSLLSKIIGTFRGNLSRFVIPIIKYVRKHMDEVSVCIVPGSVVIGKATSVLRKLGVKTVKRFKGHWLTGIRCCERIAYKNASVNMFLTYDDEKALMEAYGNTDSKSVVIGTFDYKDQEKRNIDDKVEKKYDLVISGSLASYQTSFGVEQFAKKYLKVAEEEISEISVLLTGKNPSETVLNIQKERPDVFSIKANPKDIYSEVQSGHIYVFPTCIGGGLKLKVMDGLKCGLPVLTHQNSARGYDYCFDKPYYRVYNDEVTFRQGLKDLIEWNNTIGDGEIINRDYYSYFGYEQGLKRFSDALSF